MKTQVHISYLEVPMDLKVKLIDAMYLTAEPIYQTKTIEFGNLHKIVQSDYRQYSPYTFNNGKKIRDNWSNNEQNIIVFDIDDGLSILGAEEIFKDYKYFICTTKSHRKEKKGLVADRFRIILHAINIPKGEHYFDFLKELEIVYPFIDKQVNNKVGAFMGYFDCEYKYNEGISFDCQPLVELAETRKQLKQQARQNIKHDTETSAELADVKLRLSRDVVADIIQSFGYEVSRQYKFRYRADDRTPSASIRQDGYIKDFGSDLSTDAIGFVQDEMNCTFKEALSVVASFVGCK